MEFSLHQHFAHATHFHRQSQGEGQEGCLSLSATPSPTVPHLTVHMPAIDELFPHGNSHN